LWGIQEPWETAFEKIKQNGYYAVEFPADLYTPEQRTKATGLVKQHNLHFVYQIHTSDPRKPKKERNIDVHVESFRRQVRDAKELGAIFCNSHSGYDGWTDGEKVTFFSKLLQVEKEEGMICCHETHRRRALYNPWTTKAVLEGVPELKLTADLSHWFCVMEENMDDEMELVELVGKHTYLIHARVGHSQGPQVPDPRAPEWMPWVEASERCWDVIWRQQLLAKREFCYVEPEFGPAPYMPMLPFTQVPVTNLWDVCEWMMVRQKERFDYFMKEHGKKKEQ
jgi:sugar phosphate isomerase/epimerase